MQETPSWSIEVDSPTVTHEPGLSTAYGNSGAISSRVSIPNKPLSGRNILPGKAINSMARLFKSLLQSDIGSPHKNFEAVVLEGRDLWHWWRDNSAPGKPWKHGQRIIANRAAFPGSIIQSDFRRGAYGNFEVVVPLFGEGGLIELWHMWHDNSDGNNPWSFAQRITEPGRRVVGPASIIQSIIGAGSHGNFEVVVPVVGNGGRVELRHYWHDNSDGSLPWSIGQQINDPAHEVIGGGCIIQSNFGSGAHGNFEVAAWVRLPGGHSVLQHYWHDNSDGSLPWQNGQVIAQGVKGNGVIIQSSFGSPNRNFEVVVPVDAPGGRTYLGHFWHDNSDGNLPWPLGQIITEVASADASASIFESDDRNFEVLVDECRQSLVDYYHPNNYGNVPWLRHAVLIGEPADREIRDTTRICQLTGEFDRAGWDGTGPEPFAFNKTESRFGVRGTDLGVSFDHKNRVYFLFGDTWRVGETLTSHVDWDAIAFCTDTSVQGGLSLTFYKQPPIVAGIKQKTFEVPLDGFSHQGRMFCFFSTDARWVDGVALMGRSVLAVSENDGYEFVPLLTFSKNKFINVSVEHAFLDPVQARIARWAEDTEVLWVWGSGRYRASPVYLALIDLEGLLGEIRFRQERPVELTNINTDRGPVRFFAGTDNRVLWSPNEWDSVPLFCAGDVGELSGRRNAIFNRYFLTYNSANPRVITLRHAPQPWGQWSEGITIFDPRWGSGPDQPVGAGYGTFMHIPWNVKRVDYVQDNAFLKGRRDDEWGDQYGPYQITRYSTGKANEVCELYYTMSTWNPYQSMLMRTRIRAQDLFG
jgi:hypothetical protein